MRRWGKARRRGPGQTCPPVASFLGVATLPGALPGRSCHLGTSPGRSLNFSLGYPYGLEEMTPRSPEKKE